MEQQVLVSTEAQSMLENWAVRVIHPHQKEFVSQIFLVPKKDGGHWPVVNVKGTEQVHHGGALEDGGLLNDKRPGMTGLAG